MKKHRGIVEYQSELFENYQENAKEIESCKGREGSIIGVALEAAAIHLAQLADNRFVITPASLRSEEGGATGSDLLLWDSHDTQSLWSAQVKRRVDSDARRKYTKVPLICGIHHMIFPNRPVIETLRAIEQDRDREELRHIGRRLISITRGSPQHGCTQYNPQFSYQYLRKVHKPTIAA